MSARAIREARHGRERLRRLGKRATMTAPRPKIDPSLLPDRLSALSGLDRVREAAAGLGAYLVGGSVRDLLLGRERADIDELHGFLVTLGAKIIRAPREDQWAPGYYSIQFEDPDGIRLELNHVPGKGLLG